MWEFGFGNGWQVVSETILAHIIHQLILLVDVIDAIVKLVLVSSILSTHRVNPHKLM